MNIIVRPARADDIATIAEFNTCLAAETEGKSLDASVVKKGVAALVADPQKGRYFLAESDGHVIGQVAVSYEWSDWRNGWFWWLQSVYVRVDGRGQGVFRRLFQEVSVAAQGEGVIGLRLYVEHENQAAHATYRSLGMELTTYQCYETLY